MPYAEKLRVPVLWWVLMAAGVLALFVVYDVSLGRGVAVAAGLLLATAGVVWLTAQSAMTVAVDHAGLHAGPALLPPHALGDVEALSQGATARARGRDADPHAFFLLRGYVRTSVRVQVEDPSDPVPYWMVSTRNPQRLAAALVAVRDGSRPTATDV